MEYVLIGVVSAFNLIVVKMKLERKRYEDAFFDLGLMIVLAYMFSGSYGGTVVAMVASLAISLYLFVSPPKFTGKVMGAVKQELDEMKKINSYTSSSPKRKFDL